MADPVSYITCREDFLPVEMNVGTRSTQNTLTAPTRGPVNPAYPTTSTCYRSATTSCMDCLIPAEIWYTNKSLYEKEIRFTIVQSTRRFTRGASAITWYQISNHDQLVIKGANL